MAEAELERFVEAQQPVLADVEAELATGRKRTHWMWFVFPQLQGLGRSPMAQHFGLRDLSEAQDYLAHQTLGPRLADHVRLVLKHQGKSAHAIFGSPDDLKFQSCLTVFREAATDTTDARLFQEGLEVFYAGEEDGATLELLKCQNAVR